MFVCGVVVVFMSKRWRDSSGGFLPIPRGGLLAESALRFGGRTRSSRIESGGGGRDSSPIGPIRRGGLGGATRVEIRGHATPTSLNSAGGGRGHARA